MAHAQFAPSKLHRVLACPASVALEVPGEDTSSEFADEGTAAHEIAARALCEVREPHHYLGHLVTVGERTFTVDEDMAQGLRLYTDYARALEAAGAELFVEVKLEIDHLTGEPGAKGTADVCAVAPDEMTIVDLKWGRGVRVDAPGNPQLEAYAIGMLRVVDDLGLAQPQRVRMVIVQPRLAHVSEHVVDVSALRERADVIRAGVDRARKAIAYHATYGGVHEKYFAPGEEQCRFCPAKARCPALRDFTLATVADDFVDLDETIAEQMGRALDITYDNAMLGNLMGAVDLIEGWCKAIRGRVEAELVAGNAVPGYKLVEGRRGARAWTDPAAAEALLKQMRLKVEEMYDLKLISPTSAEKLAKAGAIGPRQWKKAQELIGQSDGKPSVAPESDKRPAISVDRVAAAAEFDDLSLV